MTVVNIERTMLDPNVFAGAQNALNQVQKKVEKKQEELERVREAVVESNNERDAAIADYNQAQVDQLIVHWSRLGLVWCTMCCSVVEIDTEWIFCEVFRKDGNDKFVRGFEIHRICSHCKEKSEVGELYRISQKPIDFDPLPLADSLAVKELDKELTVLEHRPEFGFSSSTGIHPAVVRQFSTSDLQTYDFALRKEWGIPGYAYWDTKEACLVVGGAYQRPVGK